ncbi:MAG: hypothetical protein COB30_000065 [Ectothiorhodospiraceae bacterium]|nr:hypothetical protein [Ectothiorhodospiraceae bacterium]
MALIFTVATVNGADIQYVGEFETDCIENSSGKCKNWPGAKYKHLKISMVLENSSFVSGSIQEVKLYPCVPKLYPLDYDVYRIDHEEYSFYETRKFSFRLAIVVKKYGNCFGIDLIDNKNRSIPTIDNIVVKYDF